jgi:hypothetical protein
MFQKASAGELASRQALAQRVRNELGAAGLPVPAPGLSPVLAAGAEVTVDEGADAAGGVFVSWSASPRLPTAPVFTSPTGKPLRHSGFRQRA